MQVASRELGLTVVQAQRPPVSEALQVRVLIPTPEIYSLATELLEEEDDEEEELEEDELEEQLLPGPELSQWSSS